MKCFCFRFCSVAAVVVIKSEYNIVVVVVVVTKRIRRRFSRSVFGGISSNVVFCSLTTHENQAAFESTQVLNSYSAFYAISTTSDVCMCVTFKLHCPLFSLANNQIGSLHSFLVHLLNSRRCCYRLPHIIYFTWNFHTLSFN